MPFAGLVLQRPGATGILPEKHLAAALPQVVGGDYVGEHWLASFAVLALSGAALKTHEEFVDRAGALASLAVAHTPRLPAARIAAAKTFGTEVT